MNIKGLIPLIFFIFKKGRCCIVALSKKQKKFADEYLIDCNATQAAIRAGYSPNGLNKRVTRMMANDGIKAYIEEQLEKIHNERIADAAEVMMYLTSVLRGESTSEIVVVEGEGDGCSSARRMDKAPDEREKLKAAELLGKRFGLFKDNVNITGAVPVVISGEENLED